MRYLLTLSLVLGATAFGTQLTACGGDDGGEEAFDNFQDCFVDHHEGDESLDVNDSIVACCIEHPIAGHTLVCGADAAACQSYLTANLDASSATADERTAACADYVVKKDE